jgi:GcrA cell cycle regulator
MQWDAEKQQFIQKLWPTHSAGSIVEKIWFQFGEKCNRNMVIGIVHRMQRKKRLEKKGAGVLPKVNNRAAPRQRKPRTMKPKPKPQWKPMIQKYDGPRVRVIRCPCQVVDLESWNCHWPFGDPREPSFYFCGAVVAEGRQYCPTHLTSAYDRRAG